MEFHRSRAIFSSGFLLRPMRTWGEVVPFRDAWLWRGDRGMGKVLRAAHRYQGNWGQALRESSLNPDFFVCRRRDLDEIFPWDFIDHGIPKEELKEEYLIAMKEAD